MAAAAAVGAPLKLPYDRSASADRLRHRQTRRALRADAAHALQGLPNADAGTDCAASRPSASPTRSTTPRWPTSRRRSKTGRGQLDASTIAIVEHNLQIIDQAISQAREALVGDPANSYLSSHLVEARRRKLDLLRRATALERTNWNEIEN